MTYVMDASAIIDLPVRSDPGERVGMLVAGGDEVGDLMARLGSLAMRRAPVTTGLLAA